MKPSGTTAKRNKLPPLDPTYALNILKKKYPDAHCALHFETPFQLLVATILSAQCTDERVNLVTPILFARFPNSHEMAQASVEEIEEIIRSTGFYKNKARNLKSCAQTLVEQYGGKIPEEMDMLIGLAGVGRKTANVVLGNAFQISSGVVVDTHVTRLSNRFRWVKTENAVEIEQILNKMIPKSDWILVSHLLISHGRALCKARSPQCEKCFLADRCPGKL